MFIKLEDKQYPLAPEGVHNAVCVDVVDKGMMPTGPDQVLKPKVSLVWQIDELDEKGRRFTAAKLYTVSLNEKATLRKDLDKWCKFPEEELKAGFDLESVLIGKPAQVQVAHVVTTKGKTFANVTTVTPLMKGVQPIQPLDYVRQKDRPKKDEQGNPVQVKAEYDDDV